MAEYYIEDNVVAAAEADGWFSRKLQWVGRDGAPDRLFVKLGRVVFIEFKDKDKKSVGLQKKECERLRKAGAEVYVNVDTIVQGCRILGCKPLRAEHALCR